MIPLTKTLGLNISAWEIPPHEMLCAQPNETPTLKRPIAEYNPKFNKYRVN